MANGSIVSRLLNRGKSVRDISEEWWSRRYGEILGAAAQLPDIFRERKKREAVEYAQELLTQQRFQSRLNVPIQNAFSDRTIYDNKTINELESQIKRMYDQDIKRFPKQSADLEDIYQSQKIQLEQYRSLNTNYFVGREKIQPAKDFVMEFTNELANVNWKDLTPEKRMDFENRLYKGTQDIASLGRMIANNKEYFANHESFNIDADDIQIGIIGSYNQLLTQLDTIDPDGNIINKEELAMIGEAVRDNRPDRIIQRNEQIVGQKIARITGKGQEFDKAHATWKIAEATSQDPIFKQEKANKYKLFDEYIAEQKKQLTTDKIKQAEYDINIRNYVDNPNNWSSMVYMDTETGRGKDVRNVDIDMTRLQNQMDTIDADYKQDTGGEYSKWRGRATPWRLTKEETEEQIELAKKKKLEEDVTRLGITTPTVGGATTVSGVDPFVVSKLHEPVTPITPTMPTGESVEIEVPSVDSMHKELAKKHKTPIKNIKSLWNDYNEDDDIKMNFPDYVGEALITTPPVSEDSDIATGKPLYKTYTNKREARYGETVIPLTTKPFKVAQSNLASIASDKFGKLSSKEKSKYKGSKKEALRLFVKDKFEQWLRESGRYGKPYAEGDYIYFFPTKVDKSGKAIKKVGEGRYKPKEYTLFYPDAFGTTAPTRFKIPNRESDSAYPKFAKDFDAFRKYLQKV